MKIELYSHVFIRSVALEVAGEDVEFSDNFFDLLPGVKKRVALTCALDEVQRIKDKLVIV